VPDDVWPGRPDPLGATADAGGVNFALYSAGARRVEVCLLEGSGGRLSERRVVLPERTDHVWHGYLPGVRPGQRYGYRVHGPWEPFAGQWFNPAKLLADPYARAFTGGITYHGALCTARGDGTPDARDSAPYVPLSLVTAPDPGPPPARPRVPWTDTVIYEAHVRGFTASHPEVPAELRGSYAGLGHPAAIEHLTHLGITAVELLPVHHSLTEPSVAARGLTNYWGYNTLGYFAPDARFSASGDRGGQVTEFRAMVDALHAAGIEVLLDVVYNHTAEGQPLGPTLCYRGIDNRTYYRLEPDEPSRYRDYTGCGNTLDSRQAPVLRLVMDSLRYWVTAMGVDGFRFDLASALTRSRDGVDKYSGFLAAIAQDPVLGGVKLIAEPWDLGIDGYRVGGFPPPWAEWNGRYRDAVRDYWRGAGGDPAELGTRLAGSEDLYAARRPHASVNFITAHDGFTLADLVSYDRKHNDDNGEGNRDGTDDNRSTNLGAEGPTDDEEVLTARRRQARNLLATLLLSAGVPMLTAGDELGRTQRGNNNAYCQDNELSWLDWSGVDTDLLAFTRDLIALRRAEPVFRRRSFFTGAASGTPPRRDLTWYRPDGRQLRTPDWHRRDGSPLGVLLDGTHTGEREPHGEPRTGHTYLLWFHSGTSEAEVTLPRYPGIKGYEQVVNTGDGQVAGRPGDRRTITPRCVVVLRAT
jgi:isoamylase